MQLWLMGGVEAELAPAAVVVVVELVQFLEMVEMEVFMVAVVDLAGMEVQEGVEYTMDRVAAAGLEVRQAEIKEVQEQYMALFLPLFILDCMLRLGNSII
jgi:hypothetical protein